MKAKVGIARGSIDAGNYYVIKLEVPGMETTKGDGFDIRLAQSTYSRLTDAGVNIREVLQNLIDGQFK